MLINNTTLDALHTGFNTKLQAGYGRAPALHEQFSMEVPSSTSMETYAWLVLLSRMREWLGPRQVQNVEKKVMQLVNRDFEHTVGVDRNDIEDDKLGIYGPMFEQMGYDQRYLWCRLAVEALVGNGNWIDGSAFFLTTRKYGKNTINNKGTSALSETTFNTAYQALMEFVGFDGTPLGVVPDLLIVGPKNRTTAFEIVKAQNRISIAGTNTAAAAVPNPNAGLVEYVVLPELVGTYDDYWFLAQTKAPVKPVAVQKRKEGPLVRWDRDTDECVKTHNRNDYGVHSRGAACLTLPHLIYGGIL